MRFVGAMLLHESAGNSMLTQHDTTSCLIWCCQDSACSYAQIMIKLGCICSTGEFYRAYAQDLNTVKLDKTALVALGQAQVCSVGDSEQN